MNLKTLAFASIISIFVVSGAYAQNDNDNDTDVYFGIGYSPSVSIVSGVGHDIVFSIYDEDNWGPSAFLVQFRYTDFMNSQTELQLEDVGRRLNTINFDSERSFVSPRNELSVSVGGRVFRSTSKNKEAYFVVEFIHGSLRGTYQAIEVLHGAFSNRVIGRKAVSKTEVGAYNVLTIGPTVRARLNDNLYINGQVRIGGGGLRYRELTRNDWTGIWYTRASIGAEFYF